MLDTRFPRPRGDIGNALSYDFPVRYKIVRGAHATRIMGDHPDAGLLEPFVVAAQELEAEGVKAITTSCGFLAPFQKPRGPRVWERDLHCCQCGGGLRHSRSVARHRRRRPGEGARRQPDRDHASVSRRRCNLPKFDLVAVVWLEPAQTSL